MKQLELEGMTFSGLDKDGDVEIEFSEETNYIYFYKKDIPTIIEYLQSLLDEKLK